MTATAARSSNRGTPQLLAVAPRPLLARVATALALAAHVYMLVWACAGVRPAAAARLQVHVYGTDHMLDFTPDDNLTAIGSRLAAGHRLPTRAARAVTAGMARQLRRTRCPYCVGSVASVASAPPPPRAVCATYNEVLLVVILDDDGSDGAVALAVAKARAMYTAAFPRMEFFARTPSAVPEAGPNASTVQVHGCADAEIAGACSGPSGLLDSQRRAALTYACLARAARLWPGQRGYLLVTQSTVLNFWNLRRLPLDRPWLSSAYAGHTRDVTAVGVGISGAEALDTGDMAVWDDPVYGRRAARTALAKLSHADRSAVEAASNGKGLVFVGTGAAAATAAPQVAYVPGHSMPVFDRMARVFRAHCVWGGIALPTLLHAIGDVVELVGETVAHFDRHIAAHLYSPSIDFVAPLDLSLDANWAVVQHSFLPEAASWTINCGKAALNTEGDGPQQYVGAQEAHVSITRSLLQWIRKYPDGKPLPAANRWHDAGLVVVSGASENHLDGALCLVRCIRHQHPDPTRVPIVFYDLGLSPRGRRALLDADPSVELRTFPFALLPPFFDITVAAGEYGWKAWCLVPVVTESVAPVLWLDAGQRVLAPLGQVATAIRAFGAFSAQSKGSLGKWVHPLTLQFFRSVTAPGDVFRPTQSRAFYTSVDAAYSDDGGVVSGGFAGFMRSHSAFHSVAVPWAACSLERACIAPHGSSRANHRQDQAALSVLMAWAEPAAYRQATQLNSKRWRELDARVLQHGEKWPCSVDHRDYCVRHDAVYMHRSTVERLTAANGAGGLPSSTTTSTEPLEHDLQAQLAHTVSRFDSELAGCTIEFNSTSIRPSVVALALWPDGGLPRSQLTDAGRRLSQRRFLTRLLSVNDELDMGLCRYLRGAWRAVRPFIGSRIVDGSCYDECSLVVGGRPECDASEAQDVCRGDVAAQYCVCGPEADQLPVRTVTLAAPAGIVPFLQRWVVPHLGGRASVQDAAVACDDPAATTRVDVCIGDGCVAACSGATRLVVGRDGGGGWGGNVLPPVPEWNGEMDPRVYDDKDAVDVFVASANDGDTSSMVSELSRQLAALEEQRCPLATSPHMPAYFTRTEDCRHRDFRVRSVAEVAGAAGSVHVQRFVDPHALGAGVIVVDSAASPPCSDPFVAQLYATNIPTWVRGSVGDVATCLPGTAAFVNVSHLAAQIVNTDLWAMNFRAAAVNRARHHALARVWATALLLSDARRESAPSAPKKLPAVPPATPCPLLNRERVTGAVVVPSVGRGPEYDRRIDAASAKLCTRYMWPLNSPNCRHIRGMVHRRVQAGLRELGHLGGGDSTDPSRLVRVQFVVRLGHMTAIHVPATAESPAQNMTIGPADTVASVVYKWCTRRGVPMEPPSAACSAVASVVRPAVAELRTMHWRRCWHRLNSDDGGASRDDSSDTLGADTTSRCLPVGLATAPERQYWLQHGDASVWPPATATGHVLVPHPVGQQLVTMCYDVEALPGEPTERAARRVCTALLGARDDACEADVEALVGQKREPRRAGAGEVKPRPVDSVSESGREAATQHLAVWAYRGTFTQERAFFTHLLAAAFPAREVVWTHDVRVFEAATVRLVLESQFSQPSDTAPGARVPPPVPYAVVSWNSEPHPKTASMLVHTPDVELVVYKSDNPAQVWLPYMLVAGGPRLRLPDLPVWSEVSVEAQAPAMLYLHANCAGHRESLVALLVQAGVDVVAGGVCTGHSSARQSPEVSLAFADYGGGAPLAAAGQFRLWLAAENVVGDDAPPGYLTEKLLQAFAAGTVPVFWGDSRTATQIFNPHAYIDVGDYPNLDAAVADVRALVQDTARLASMHAEPVFQPGAERLVAWDATHAMLAGVVDRLRHACHAYDHR